MCTHLLQDFGDAGAHLLKGLRGELVFAQVLQDLQRARRHTRETGGFGATLNAPSYSRFVHFISHVNQNCVQGCSDFN